MLGFGAISEHPIGDSGWHYDVPASDTEEGRTRVAEYYAALGHFVDAFSEVETIVAQTLRKYAEASVATAQVIFYRHTLDNSLQLIEELAKLKLESEPMAELKRVLKQLDYIRIMRNYVLHKGAREIAEGRGHVVNELRGGGEPRVYPISPEILDNMRSDTRTIIIKLAYEHLGRPRPLSAHGIEILEATLGAGWKYTHPNN